MSIDDFGRLVSCCSWILSISIFVLLILHSQFTEHKSVPGYLMTLKLSINLDIKACFSCLFLALECGNSNVDPQPLFI